MISKYFSSLEGISTLGIIGLVAFFGMFILLVVWVVKLDKHYLAKMGNLPLENQRENNNKSENKNETE